MVISKIKYESWAVKTLACRPSGKCIGAIYVTGTEITLKLCILDWQATLWFLWPVLNVFVLLHRIKCLKYLQCLLTSFVFLSVVKFCIQYQTKNFGIDDE